MIKQKKKAKTGAVRIDPEVLKDAKVMAIRKDMLIQDYVTEAVREKNHKESK